MGTEGSRAEQTGGGEVVESTTMLWEVVVDSGDVLDVWDELEDDPLDLAPVVRSRLLDDLLELREMSRSHSGERGKCTHEDGYVPKDIRTALGLHHERLKCRECLLHVAEERGILGGLLVRSSSGYMRPIWSATGMKTGTCGTHTSLSMAAASSYSSRRV